MPNYATVLIKTSIWIRDRHWPEVHTHPVLCASRWEVIFSNGPGWQMRDGFSSRLEHDRWFFEQAKLGSQKEKWIFFKIASGYKKKGRWIILWVSLGRQNKVLKLADKSLIANLIKSTINVNVPMKCVFQFSLRILNKNHSYFLLLLNAVPSLYLVCSFHNSDLLIPFITLNSYI